MGSLTLTPNEIIKGEFGQKEPMPSIVDTGETGNWIIILRHPSTPEMLLSPMSSQLINGEDKLGLVLLLRFGS